MPFHVLCVLNYIMPYFVRFYLQHVIIFHYVRNIKLNIMTTNNENNHIIKVQYYATLNNIIILEVRADSRHRGQMHFQILSLNILSKQLIIRVPVLYHNLVAVARLTCIALTCLSPVVSGLRFIYGLYALSEERVVILLRLQARLC